MGRVITEIYGRAFQTIGRAFSSRQSYITYRKIYKVIFSNAALWKREYRIFCRKNYSYVIICSFEISAIFLQISNISSSDTLKPKKHTHY